MRPPFFSFRYLPEKKRTRRARCKKRKGRWLVRGGGGRSEQGSPPCECWHALCASVFAAAMLCKTSSSLLPYRRLAWLYGSPCARGGMSVIHPASQRPHVRAIACDLYHVGRGNAQLMSQGECRTGQVTHFAEGSRGLFPLRLSLASKTVSFHAERNGFCLAQLIPCEQVNSLLRQRFVLALIIFVDSLKPKAMLSVLLFFQA